MLTLHDGQFDNGGSHVGESLRTTTKDNAGGAATFNETFVMNKPGAFGKGPSKGHAREF